MTGSLKRYDDDGGSRCSLCGIEAAGPCASCRQLVCGDCSAIVRGGAKIFAVCLRCEPRAESTLRARWTGLLLWLAGLLVALATLTALAGWLSMKR